MAHWIAKGSSRGISEGYRSGLEQKVADQLKEWGVDAVYEDKDHKISYEKPATKNTYLPDFRLPNGIILETKGRLVQSDRAKHLLIKKQHPELDIRFVFSNPNAKLYKGSKTTYGDWATKNGFKYSSKMVPKEWTEE